MTKKDQRKATAQDWALESELDTEVTLEGLIKAPPFRQVSSEDGESVTEAARIPGWLHRRVVKIRERAGSPYDLNSDVVRDAIFIGLRILNIRMRTEEQWIAEDKMFRAIDSSSEGRRLKDRLDGFVDNLEDTFNDKDFDKAKNDLTQYIEGIMKLPDSWYKSRALRLMRTNPTILKIANMCSDEIKNFLGQ